jgi:two-component system sensor histidine kinase ChiS
MACLVLSGCSSQPQAPAPRAVRGVLDLSGWDFQRQGPVKLDGEWEFHWGRLELPAREGGPAGGLPEDYLPVPGLWRGRTAKGVALSASGYGIYRLHVRLPPVQGAKSLLVGGVLSVCRVWVDGVPLAATGIPGRDREAEKPADHLASPRFDHPGEAMEIVLQVSNHHNVQGGLSSSVYLGTEAQIARMLNHRWIVGAFTGGALLIMGLFHLVLHALRRSERANLHFGLFCIMWCLGTVFGPSSGFLVSQLIALPWDWYIDLSLLPFGFTTPLMVWFYHELFPKKHGRYVSWFYLVLGMAYSAYILLSGPNAFGFYPFLYFVMTRTAYVYLFAAFAVDLARREKGALFLIPGYGALFLAEFGELLFDLNILGSTDFTPYGVFIFVLSYSFFMSARFSRSFSRVEKLSQELGEANARLLRLDKLKDDFLDHTAHELKTPLAGMVGVSEALLAGEDGPLPHRAKRHLETLVHSGKRLSGLVNDILDLSRLEHDEVALEQRAVSLRDTAQGITALLERMATAKGLWIRNQVGEGLPLVWADQARLEQVLFNLVGNSIKYSQKGGMVISAQVKGGWVEVAVADDGPGIPRECLEQVFNSQQPRGSRVRGVAGGMGLGLSITRRLVELHGGAIRAEAGKDGGWVMRFTLPRAEDGAGARLEGDPGRGEREDDGRFQPHPGFLALPGGAVEGEAVSGGYQVLVVDDEPVNLQVIAASLRSAGLTYRTAPHGAAALEMIEGGEVPHLVLLDAMMPGPDGCEVCRRLRRRHSPSELPVIMLTVRNRVADVVAGFEAGANDFLSRPFVQKELLVRISNLLKLREAYAVLAENERLRRELSFRQKTERDLRLMQLRLSSVLDCMDDAVLAVNQSREIAFCNRAFEDLTGQPADRLLGQPLLAFLRRPDSKESRRLLRFLSDASAAGEQAVHLENISVRLENGPGLERTVLAAGLEIDGEPLFVLVLRPPGKPGGGQAVLNPIAMLRELDDNRRLMSTIEDNMRGLDAADLEKKDGLMADLGAVGSILERLRGQLALAGESPDKRTAAAQVMRGALECWMEATGTTKAELAEQSGIWNVYMERDGYLRTQTLDKYLSEETLPRRPRWGKVMATAEFVLAGCGRDTAARKELEIAFARLKALARDAGA